MIAVNELRIGNWVEDFAGNPVQVVRLTKNKQPLENPIRITEEILDKCDFKDYGFRCSLSGVNSTKIKLPCNNGERAMLRSIRYLHQLQNLYFAYFLEELRIDL